MSLRNAINAKCRDCIYDPLCGGGTWRESGGVISFSGGAWNGQKAKRTGANKMQVLKDNGSMGAVTCGLSK